MEKLFSKTKVNKFHIKPNSKIDLIELSNIFSKVTKKSAIICDSGFADVILPSNIKFGDSQYCIHPSSQVSMGFAVPAIMGVSQNKNQTYYSRCWGWLFHDEYSRITNYISS